MNPASIDVENITVQYHGRIALHQASVKLTPGSISGLVGMNGSGKSTLFKAIMGFVKPQAGRVLINGLPVRQAQKQHWIAYVPQAEEVDWQFPVSVWDVVMMGRHGHLNWLRIPQAQDRAVVAASLERVQMQELQARQIGELSGGQKKRTFLARALAQESPILLLDEPFTGVDVRTEKAMIDLLLDLRHQGYTILIATHDLSTIESFCDQVVLVNKTVLAYGATADIFTAENLSRTFGGVCPDNIQHGASHNP